MPGADLHEVGEEGLVIHVSCGFVVISSRSAVAVPKVLAEVLIEDVSGRGRTLPVC